MKKDKKINLLPFRIQLFSDDPTPASDPNENKTFSKEEVDAIIAEREKYKLERENFKRSFDLKASELAETKKQLKARSTEDEIKDAEKAEKERLALEKEETLNRELEELKNKTKKYEITNKLLETGMSKENTAKLSDSIIKGDHNDLISVLSEVILDITKETTKSIEEKFVEKLQGTGGNPNPDQKEKSYGAKLVEQYGSKKSGFRKPGE